MIVAVAGGVGGAKLADGLYHALPPDALAVVVNTADDFELFGLRISPDVDTVMYTLAGLANPATGWGVMNESWQALEMLGRYGYNTWFRLGDRDFATHIARTMELHAGRSLSEVTQRLTAALDVRAIIAPMCDEPVATLVDTPAGRFAFQEYFVRRHHSDPVLNVAFDGIEVAAITPTTRRVIDVAQAIIICPSNPIVSIGPILAVGGMRDAMDAARAPIVAVSPIVGGKALRGPADQMLAGLGHDVSVLGVARLYAGLIDGFVIDLTDAAYEAEILALGMQPLITNTIMHDESERRRLAVEVLEFAATLRSPVSE